MASLTLSKLLADLPADPALAFVELAKRASETSKKISDANSVEVRELVMLLERFALKFNLVEGIAAKQNNESWKDQLKFVAEHVARKVEISRRLAEAEIEVGNLINDFENKINHSLAFGEAILEEDDKQYIRKRLNDIRNRIDESDLPENKKNALFEKINKLNSELDRHGTSTDIFMGFALDVSLVARKMHSNVKPIIDDVKEILQKIYVGRAKSEGVELPSPEELPQLPSSMDDP